VLVLQLDGSAVGGEDSPDTVEVYDTSTKVWTELAGGGMSLARNYSASAVYKGTLNVVGGENEAEETLRSVGVYDFATQQWSLLPTEMATARRFHGVVVCEDMLYVVGGSDAEDIELASVEVCDFATETWSILPAPMPQAREYIINAVVQHKGKVFVVGGFDRGGEWLQSVRPCALTVIGQSQVDPEQTIMSSRVWQCTTLPLKHGAFCRLK
jgi:N-acetylneuraminic acid mutarotase